MSAPERPTCETCPYWERRTGVTVDDLGACNRFSPGEYEHGDTLPGEWCGEHPDFPAWLAPQRHNPWREEFKKWCGTGSPLRPKEGATGYDKAMEQAKIDAIGAHRNAPDPEPSGEDHEAKCPSLFTKDGISYGMGLMLGYTAADVERLVEAAEAARALLPETYTFTVRDLIAALAPFRREQEEE